MNTNRKLLSFIKHRDSKYRKERKTATTTEKEATLTNGMFFTQRICLHSAKHELLTVGSRWRRLWAKTTIPVASSHSSSVSKSSSSSDISSDTSRHGSFPQDASLPASTATISSASSSGPPIPRVTIIPTLHVASISFYDTVLRYLDSSVKAYGDRACILLEGICDGEEDAELQRQEYLQIASTPSLQEMLRKKAEENAVFPPDVQQEICAELGVEYPVLLEHIANVRLQECYLKPQMAASFGLHLHNESDMNMKEVQAVLRAELEAEAAMGNTDVPNTLSVRQIGQFPRVRQAREWKVARAALAHCQLWLAKEQDGEVVIPWGFFHSDPIVRTLRMGVPTPSPSVPPIPGVPLGLGGPASAGGGGGKDTTAGLDTVDGLSFTSTLSTSTSSVGEEKTDSHKGMEQGERDPNRARGTHSNDEEEMLWRARALPVFFEEDREWSVTVPFGIPDGILSSTPTKA